MEGLSEIIRMRSTPGVLIFDLAGRLLYSNSAAFDMLPGFRDEIKGTAGKPRILEECKNLCSGLKSGGAGAREPDGTNCRVVYIGNGHHCSLRAFFIGGQGGGDPSHIMILIESVVKKHSIDFKKAGADFRLTKRELEVLKLICEGFSNKYLSETLFISEYTVKDHIKKIMKKMKVTSRNEIMAALSPR